MAKMKPLFPFTLISSEHNGGVGGYLTPEFLASKPKNLNWFCVDAEIRSSTTVLFVVYDMADSYYGGRGRHIGSYICEVKPERLTRHIKMRAERIAAQYRADLRAEQEDLEIERLASQLMRENKCLD